MNSKIKIKHLPHGKVPTGMKDNMLVQLGNYENYLEMEDVIEDNDFDTLYTSDVYIGNPP